MIAGTSMRSGSAMMRGTELGRNGRAAAFHRIPGRLGAVALLPLLMACGEADREGSGRPGVGNPAPAYAATTLDGDELSLEELRGRVVVLNVWATWCAPCVREMPGLEELHRSYGEHQVAVLGASIDRGTAEPAVRRFVDEHDITFTILLDPDGTVESRFRTIGVPETFLLDAEGTIRHRWIGEFDPGAAEVRARIDELLDELPEGVDA